MISSNSKKTIRNIGAVPPWMLLREVLHDCTIIPWMLHDKIAKSRFEYLKIIFFAKFRF